MDTPNKIYIAVYPNDDDTDTYLGDWYYGPNGRARDNLEYINKDSLLKWIQEARAIPHENAIVRDLTFQEVVNKLNSL